MNDIFYFLEKSTLYNYSDDNTVSYCHKIYQIVLSVLQIESTTMIEWFNDNHMQANPGKFQAIAVGQKSASVIKDFIIDGTEIKCEEQVKLLGIEIDFLLNFDAQISIICKKVARQLNVLQRLSKFLNENTRRTVFKSSIRSNFNFCPIIWHFCSQTNTEKLEKMQYRALRIVYNDFQSSYEDLLHRVNTTTLHLGRMQSIAIETFKCLNGIAPEYIRDLVKLKDNKYNFRYENMLQLPTVRTSRYGKNSFRFETARVWNSLPNEIRCANNFKEFKRLVHTLTGPGCKCSMCQL